MPLNDGLLWTAASNESQKDCQLRELPENTGRLSLGRLSLGRLSLGRHSITYCMRK